MPQPTMSRDISGKPLPAHPFTSEQHVPIIVLRTISYVDEHLASDLSIKALAKVFNHNGQYISHRFKQCMGISLQHYIIYKRLELSKQYLAAGNSLTTACRLSGFHDYSNFSKAFIKYVGTSPKIYQLEIYSRMLYDQNL